MAQMAREELERVISDAGLMSDTGSYISEVDCLLPSTRGTASLCVVWARLEAGD